MSDEYSCLKRCNLFSRLASKQIERLASRCQISSYARRNPIYLPGEKADSVLLLGQGRVKVSRLTDLGKETILRFIEPGELFGQTAIFDQIRDGEYAEAVEPSRIVEIPAREMRRLMRENPDVSLGVARLIGRRLQHLERRIANLTLLSNRERLVHLLLDLAERYGRPCDEGTELDIRISHHDIAKLIGCTRETVTVTLGQLHNEGSVWRARRRIIVTDIERLATSVQPPVGLLTAEETPHRRTPK